MTRFTLPVLCLVAAVAVLMVGAFGGLPSWPAAARSDVHDAATGSARAAPPVQPKTDANDAAEHKARDLRAKIDDEQRELAALTASADQARRDLAALREQRRNEQVAMAQNVAAPADDHPAIAPVAPDPDATARAAAADSNPPPAKPDVAPAADQVEQRTAPVPAAQRQLAARRLEAARTALTAGRRVRARWLLSLARSQMAQWPSAPDRPDAASPATTVQNAIGLINRGDRDGAVRAIDQVLAAASDDTGEPPRRSD